MTRKRYIKLKMAEGLSRNEAVQNAREIAAEGLSYQEDYDSDAVLQLPIELQKAIIQTVPAVIEKVAASLPAVVAALSEVVRAAAASAEAFRQELKRMEIEKEGDA